MRARPSRERLVVGKGQLNLVVEGVGDVVDRCYGPALQSLVDEWRGRRKIEVTFVDMSDYWRNDPGLAGKMQRIIAEVKSWGAAYLDKSDPDDLAKYRMLRPHVVIVATPDCSHAAVAEEWLGRNPRPTHIFIEKPLEASLDAARRLLGKVPPYDSLVLAFDHYRARVLPTREQMAVILPFLGGGVSQFTFYFFEDHSGADPTYNPRVQRDGPIENEQRTKALNQGVILDVVPHVIAILAHFCRVETLRVTTVKAGRYLGVDGDPEKPSEIERETFAAVEFVCADYAGNVVEGKTYVGKGVRGVKQLGQEHDYDTKVLHIRGLNGRRVLFDIKRSARAYLIDEKGRVQFEFSLNADPYRVFLRSVVDGSFLDAPPMALHVEVGKRILEIMEDMREPVPEKLAIPTYPCGMKNRRQSLYLEDLLQRLPFVYGVCQNNGGC